jgi:hypothetical protein
MQNQAKAAGYFKLAADQHHVDTQFHYAPCIETVELLSRVMAMMLDTSNLLPIGMMHHSKTLTAFALRPGEALRRMILKLLDIANLLPIRMMHRPN